jgi:hypothetical protein
VYLFLFLGKHGYLAVLFSQLFLNLTHCRAAGQCSASTICSAVQETTNNSNKGNSTNTAYLINHLLRGTVLLALELPLEDLECHATDA